MLHSQDKVLPDVQEIVLQGCPSKAEGISKLCVTHLHYAGFAGADYDLQDALVESTNKSSSRGERHGQSFYDYELAGPVRPSGLRKHQLSWLHPIWHAWHHVLVPACDLQRLAELTCVS